MASVDALDAWLLNLLEAQLFFARFAQLAADIAHT
jgi:hypothetical protein